MVRSMMMQRGMPGYGGMRGMPGYGGMMGGYGSVMSMGGVYGPISPDELLTDISPAGIASRSLSIRLWSLQASTCFSAPLVTVSAAGIAAHPFPCRLTTQELVELLKMPTCFGPARRVVLDHMGNRYGRRFINHWAFVRFAREQNLDVDFTTPPKRPDPRQSVERMIRALDQSTDDKTHRSSTARSGS